MARQPVTGRTRDLVIFLDKRIFWLAKHWLLLANVAVAVYLGLPILAPVLMAAGFTAPAQAIYTAYKVACHQMPSRSYFLFGQGSLISAPPAGVVPGGLSSFIGNAELGFKVAFCHRDVAIYGAILAGGLLFALVRDRLKPLSWKVYVLLLLPMAVDGTTQLFGLRESNWWLRTITGVLFGGASVWLAYPYLEEGFADIRQEINDKLHLE